MQSRLHGWNRFGMACRAALAVVALLVWTGAGVRAQLPNPPAAWQFDLTGVLQAATVSGGTALSGGSLTVNGHVVTVPANTIVILPANALTWQELFALSPLPYTGTFTGMALADLPTPMTTYEVHVVGNSVAGVYIAGLINISQQALNQGQGYINYIDYAAGEIFVGGSTRSRATGARIRLNDPRGRFGRVGSADPRFTVDADNPTVRSETGFPMCLPRIDPGFGVDALCPEANRVRDALAPAGYAGIFTTNPPGTGFPDPAVQAPVEIGDYVTFAGTLVNDGPSPTAGPVPATANTYISAHTIVDNIAIYTQPGLNPAYIAIDVALMGTGGTTILGATEAAARSRFEGFTTDPSRNVHLYAVDVNVDGSTTDRDWGMVGVDPGAALNGAVAGRWRFRPPCTNTLPTVRDCTPPAGGVFVPAPRELRAVLEGAWVAGAPLVANGLMAGQYHAPIGEYIFPENIPGAPMPPANFETMPFLAQGGYSSSTGVVAGILTPWPGDVAPNPGPRPPTVHVTASNTTVGSGGTVTLDATASTGTGPLSFAWFASAGSLGTPGAAITTFTAPVVASLTSVTITLTVTDGNAPPLSSTGTLTITVNPPGAPTVSVTPAGDRTVTSGTPISVAASCVDANTPPRTPCTFTWTQTNAAVAGMPVLSPNPRTGATLSFTPTLGLGIAQRVMNIQVVATNTLGVSSAPLTFNVTVNPIADTVTITAAEYRTAKQRLLLTATSSVVSPNVVLSLQPYVSITGATVDPGAAGIFVNTGAGIYTLDLVGAPQPALAPATPLVVISNLGGISAPAAVTRVRQ